MAAQLSYSINTDAAYAGLVYAQFPHEIISGSVETVAGIPFGVAVSRGTTDTQVVLGGTAFSGISIRSLEREGAINTGAVDYKETETAGVMRTGYIWAVCPAGCAPGDAVKYTDATGVLDSGAAAAGETSIDDASWETTTAAGELGIIRLAGLANTAGV